MYLVFVTPPTFLDDSFRNLQPSFSWFVVVHMTFGFCSEIFFVTVFTVHFTASEDHLSITFCVRLLLQCLMNTESSHTIVAWWLSRIRRGYFYGYCEGLVSK